MHRRMQQLPLHACCTLPPQVLHWAVWLMSTTSGFGYHNGSQAWVRHCLAGPALLLPASSSRQGHNDRPNALWNPVDPRPHLCLHLKAADHPACLLRLLLQLPLSFHCLFRKL